MAKVWLANHLGQRGYSVMVAMYGRGAKSVTTLTMRGKTQVFGKQKQGEALVYIQDRELPPLLAMNDNAAPWYIITPNINNERKAIARLRQIGVTPYRPTYTKWRKTKTGREEVEASLLARYMFIQFNGEPNWFKLRQTDGVESVLCDGYGMPKRVSPSEVRRIAEEQMAGKWDQVKRPVRGVPAPIGFDVGDAVEPAEGHPLFGMVRGFIEKMVGGGALVKLDRMLLGKDQIVMPAGTLQAVG